MSCSLYSLLAGGQPLYPLGMGVSIIRASASLGEASDLAPKTLPAFFRETPPGLKTGRGYF